MGVTGSIINGVTMLRAVHKQPKGGAGGMPVAVYGSFLLRYAVDAAVLVGAYLFLREVAAVVAAAAGLLIGGAVFLAFALRRKGLNGNGEV